MEPSAVDIDSYFARIGYGGPAVTRLDTLREIVACHVRSVPFENLDVLLGRAIVLTPEALHGKLVTRRRGGYCFEQNGYLLEVLRLLGFEAVPLSARIRLSATRDMTPPRTHAFLKVHVDGTWWLTDVGVGSLTPTEPIRMDTEAPQATSHEAHRIVREDGRFFHQALKGDGWGDICEFTGEEMPLIDRELANWWTSTSPTSKFRLNLSAAIVGDDGTRRGIQNNKFTRRRGAEVLETFAIGSARELLAVLRREFGLEFDDDVRFGPPGSAWPT